MDRAATEANRLVLTPRLRLVPAGLEDLIEIAALKADERVWVHHPTGRHTSVEQTRAWLAEYSHRWAQDGLGYWTARLRQPLGDVPKEGFAGVGGCVLSNGAGCWNLYYRLRPELHRRGLASELCRAALTAAHVTQPQRPVIASLLEHNTSSLATARRAGLQLVWRGPDKGNPDPDAVRLIFADRPLDPDQLHLLVRPT